MILYKYKIKKNCKQTITNKQTNFDDTAHRQIVLVELLLYILECYIIYCIYVDCKLIKVTETTKQIK